MHVRKHVYLIAFTYMRAGSYFVYGERTHVPELVLLPDDMFEVLTSSSTFLPSFLSLSHMSVNLPGSRHVLLLFCILNVAVPQKLVPPKTSQCNV